MPDCLVSSFSTLHITYYTTRRPTTNAELQLGVFTRIIAADLFHHYSNKTLNAQITIQLNSDKNQVRQSRKLQSLPFVATPGRGRYSLILIMWSGGRKILGCVDLLFIGRQDSIVVM